MSKGSILVEAACILAVALALGTAVHLARPDEESRIAFVKTDYMDLYTFKRKSCTSAPKPEERPGAKEIVPEKKAEKVPEKKAVKKEEEKKEQGKTEQPHPLQEGIREIAIDEAKTEHENGTPFLDARRKRQYNAGHIPGARSVSIWEADLEGRITALFNEIPFEMPVVVYCSSGDCEDSHQLATSLKNAGYKDVGVLKGGFPEWQKKSFPIEKAEGAAGEDAGEPDEAQGGAGEEKK